MTKNIHVFWLLLLVLIAFAANSLFARLALFGEYIDPLSFTLIRLTSGAALLCVLTQQWGLKSGSLKGGVWLILYALFFSFAYMQLPTGTGALILFAAVQLTMIGGALLGGERMRGLQWAGLVAAMTGLVFLMSPSLQRPSIFGAIMMVISGAGWGLYSLNGKNSLDPLRDTAGNFTRAAIGLLLIAPFCLWQGADVLITPTGAAYALASGMMTSALGYALWYYVLKKITSIQAGVSQLSVPVIAAIAGFIFLSEPITLNFVVSSVVILGGVALVTLTRPKAR